MPGFIDTHVHLTSTGESLANSDVYATRSKQELLDVARRRASTGDGPVLLQGFDETLWEDRALPSLSEIDSTTPRPLVIRRVDGHLALANSAAIAAADISSIPGVQRDADSRPTGRITEEAAKRLGRWLSLAFTDRDVQELQLKGAALAASRGVTCVHEMSMPLELGMRDLQVFLSHRGSLPVDSVPIVATMDIPQVIDLGMTTIGGDLPADGSLGARTAALSFPYVDGSESGTLYYSDDDLAGFFQDGHGAGLQVGMHAIGDRAIEQVLSAWERVYQTLDSRQRRHFRARRHRIEHFEMPTEGQIERTAMLGLAVSIQPAFDRLWGEPASMYEIAVGAERAVKMNPFRSLLERGIEVGAGSDTPITPLDPMLALAALEEHHDEQQRLARFASIRLHTIGGARLAHQEDKKGALGRVCTRTSPHTTPTLSRKPRSKGCVPSSPSRWDARFSPPEAALSLFLSFLT